MAGSFSGGGCVSDAPPFARLALYMEKCGRFFWKTRKAWWERHWRFGGHGAGYAASGLADVALSCRLQSGGRCGKCLVFEMLAALARPRVEMLRALVRGNVARAACDLARGSDAVAVWRVKWCACRLWSGKRIVDLSFKPCVASCWVVSARKCHKGGLIAGMLFGRNGEFGVEDICDLRFCGRSIGLLVMGSLKRGPLAAFSDNSERFLCRKAPSWHFLPVLISLLGVSSALFSAGWR